MDEEDEAAAFDEFCRAHYSALVGSLQLFCGDADIAEEIVQTALERTWRRWRRIGDLDHPLAYVRQIAFNLARSKWRRALAERRANRLHGLDDDSTAPAPTATILTVRQALTELPPRQRAALIHRFHGGLSIRETAELMGVSTGAVKQLSARGRSGLRAILDDDLRRPARSDSMETTGGTAAGHPHRRVAARPPRS